MASPVAAEVVAADGTDVRVVLAYDVPGLELDGSPGEDVGALARRMRVAARAAGYGWPIRRIALVAWPGWHDELALAAAVAVLAASGQIPPTEVRQPIPLDPLAHEAALVARGYRYVEPRRGLDVHGVAASLELWDRGTLAIVEADGRARAGRDVRTEALRQWRAAGLTKAEIARLTGLGEQRVRDLLARIEG